MFSVPVNDKFRNVYDFVKRIIYSKFFLITSRILSFFFFLFFLSFVLDFLLKFLYLIISNSDGLKLCNFFFPNRILVKVTVFNYF